MKKPFAYISAAWSGQEFTDTDQAAVYCRKVYLAGFTPICPILYAVLAFAYSFPKNFHPPLIEAFCNLR